MWLYVGGVNMPFDPFTDANVYATAKDFSNAVAKGSVEVKQGDRETESKSPY